MEVKSFEILDRMTSIPALAVRMDPGNDRDRHLFARAGYGLSAREQHTRVVLVHLQSGKVRNDPGEWADRTMQTAHRHVASMWNDLRSGDALDVEFILGETKEPKRPDYPGDPRMPPVEMYMQGSIADELLGPGGRGREHLAAGPSAGSQEGAFRGPDRGGWRAPDSEDDEDDNPFERGGGPRFGG